MELLGVFLRAYNWKGALELIVTIVVELIKFGGVL